ncbi:MAG: hypothetical protein KC431_23850, partial [Myxococcales bacterium]|nr:hypothetical protein [Myxococcales bacterium]
AQMRACWDRKGRRATPARRDELKELVNDYCVKDWGGCDEQGQIQTDGCWGEATVRVHGEAARLVCAFYDRPVTEECGPLSTGICEPGWELVDCHEKGRSASEGSERKGLFKKLRKR